MQATKGYGDQKIHNAKAQIGVVKWGFSQFGCIH
jgi:hypothetical protein